MDEPAEGERPSSDPAPADPPPAPVEPASANPDFADFSAADAGSAEPASTGQGSSNPRGLSKGEQNFWAELAALDRIEAMRRQMRRDNDD